jgi:hypothetical protein
VGALFLRCKGTTFALRLTNNFEEKIADLCCAAVLQFEIPSPHTKNNSIFIYKYRSIFHSIIPYFLTAALQRCNSESNAKLA